MTTSRIDNTQPVRNGAAVICPGMGGTFQSTDRGITTFTEPSGLRFFQNLEKRFLAGGWRDDHGVFPQTSGDSATSAANAEAQVNYDYVQGKRHVLYGLSWSYNATPTNGYLQVESPSGTLLWGPRYISAAGPGFFKWPEGLICPLETNVCVNLEAGGSGVVGTVSVDGRSWV